MVEVEAALALVVAVVVEFLVAPIGVVVVELFPAVVVGACVAPCGVVVGPVVDGAGRAGVVVGLDGLVVDERGRVVVDEEGRRCRFLRPAAPSVVVGGVVVELDDVTPGVELEGCG